MRKIEELLNDWKDGNVELGIYASVDKDNNNVIIEIKNDYFKISTIQENGWMRVHYYYKDGTIEEIYER